MSDEETRIGRADVPHPVLGLRFVDSGETFYLVQGNQSEGLELNAPLALIYQLCDGNRTVQDIIQIIQDCFEREAAGEIEQHVRTGIGELIRGGAIKLPK